MSRGTTAVVNFKNLKHNFKVLNNRAPGKLVLVVKADAYGHGLKQVVSALDGADCFGVATIEEALIVRKVNAQVRILLLEGFLNQDQLKMAFHHDIDCVIHQSEQLDMLEAINTSKSMNVWLKYDSGMNRLGFSSQQYESVIARVKCLDNVREMVLMSHLACADDVEDDLTAQQTDRFLKFSGDEDSLSLSNSAALLNGLHLSDEWCRVGLALFGVSPIASKTAEEFDLKPVMTLKSKVIAIKNVSAGQGIGYSQKYRAEKDMAIAIIGIGYGDGYPWSLSDGAYVKVKGCHADIVGRVSMDMIAIDVSAIENVELGDTVLIWGDQAGVSLPVEILASYANTIPYVLLCQITSRVHYQYAN